MKFIRNENIIRYEEWFNGLIPECVEKSSANFGVKEREYMSLKDAEDVMISLFTTCKDISMHETRNGLYWHGYVFFGSVKIIAVWNTSRVFYLLPLNVVDVFNFIYT